MQTAGQSSNTSDNQDPSQRKDDADKPLDKQASPEPFKPINLSDQNFFLKSQLFKNVTLGEPNTKKSEADGQKTIIETRRSKL